MQHRSRFRSFDFWDGAVFGFALSLVFLFALSWAFSSAVQENWRALASLVAIPVAFLGAFVSLHATRYQLNHKRSQDLASARAVLPLAISRLFEVGETAILIAADRHPSQPASLEEAQQMLRIENGIIEALRDNIASADDATSQWLSVTLAWYQVYHSRLSTWFATPAPIPLQDGTTNFGHQREEALMNWATFTALIEHFYPYARGAEPRVGSRLDTSRISAAFARTHIDLEMTANFQARLDLRLNRFSDGEISKFQFKY